MTYTEYLRDVEAKIRQSTNLYKIVNPTHAPSDETIKEIKKRAFGSCVYCDEKQTQHANPYALDVTTRKGTVKEDLPFTVDNCPLAFTVTRDPMEYDFSELKLVGPKAEKGGSRYTFAEFEEMLQADVQMIYAHTHENIKH